MEVIPYRDRVVWRVRIGDNEIIEVRHRAMTCQPSARTYVGFTGNLRVRSYADGVTRVWIEADEVWLPVIP